jgi:hypothetical protein
MEKAFLGLFCGLAGILVAGVAIPRQLNVQTEIPTEKLVGVLRTLNTAEYSYRGETGRFADRDEMLAFLRKKGDWSRSPIDLENPNPYELAITTSQDGTHYQITLKRASDMNDKSTWCKPAAFSDDIGVIFLGSALGCEAPRVVPVK